MRAAVSFSSGIRKIKNIASFLDVDVVCSPGNSQLRFANVVSVVVWGRKQNSTQAIHYAASHSLPVWFLEDGFIRNCDSNAHSRKTYSLIVDKSGIYYDATRPSDLESLLKLSNKKFNELCNESALREAQLCRKLIVRENITKYNFCKSVNPAHLTTPQVSDLILVIDQTYNDASVLYGAMTQQHFNTMLETALLENPGQRVVVRTHPDVVSGSKRGYLIQYARKLNVEVSAHGDNPIEWLKSARKVYVGTSQLGYEALLCGCHVTTFGQPFYAGWGLTDDRNPVIRRGYTRSIDQLFYVTHIAYTQYRNPVDGEKWSLQQCLQHVIEQKRQFERNAHEFVCVGITSWKKGYLSQYLRSPDGSVRYSSNLPKQQSTIVPLTWGFRRYQVAAESNVTRVEDGFLRSKGLGSDFVAPSSLVIDRQGMYFDRSQPSELENLLNFKHCTREQSVRGEKLRKMIVSSGISKYNVDSEASRSANYQKVKDSSVRMILVIGQVEDDESIRRGCENINSNSALCREVRNKRPDDFIIYKPHPDVESGNRKGEVPDYVIKEYIDEVAGDLSITRALNICDECHTLTSLTGFEALLRGTKVFTYGLPFYAGWGLTHDTLVCERRTRSRSLDELVYLSLVEYPRYLHVQSGEFITPEEQIHYLSKYSCEVSLLTDKVRWINKIGNIVNALRYAA